MTALRVPLQSYSLRGGSPHVFGFSEDGAATVYLWHFFDQATGDATATGATLSALASLVAGAGQAASTAAGVTRTVTVTLIPGAASASVNATGNGVTVTATASLIVGAASAASTAAGVTRTVTASLVAGAASAASTAAGTTRTVTASLIAGSATGGAGAVDATANGATVAALVSLIVGAASGNATPPAAVSGGGGDNPRRRFYPRADRLLTVADIEEELRARYRVVREELQQDEPAEAAVRAEEIRAGRDLAELDRPDLFEIAAEVASLIPPPDAADMLRALIAIRDDEDAAAALLLSL